jgi:phytoene dehydrogenase-like protein
VQERFDAIIIGAGMSGLATGIRLAMFNKRVCILEQHSVAGGLNSYYRRGQRKLDVGLHAMTNFVMRGTRGAPLTKLLKQLRIPYDQFQLQQQLSSKIVFPEVELNFSNEFELLTQEIRDKFPQEIDGFLSLVRDLESFNETALDNKYFSAREKIGQFIKDQQLVDMLLFPLLIYGSAWEDDMDYSQFVIMFKSIFLEGFCRPQGGVRTIISLLLERFKKLGGELRFKQLVKSIEQQDGAVTGVVLNDGKKLLAPTVFSSIGYPETLQLLEQREVALGGKLSFTETIMFTKELPANWNERSSIVFFNRKDRYTYRRPEQLWDRDSAVICFSNNFSHDDYSEGVVRVTNIANYDKWKALNKEQYRQQKEKLLHDSMQLLTAYNSKLKFSVTFSDIFTPLTVERYTKRVNGAVYGSHQKVRDGKLSLDGLVLCGTDQGFLGIVGAMLSGISMANLHVLAKE